MRHVWTTGAFGALATAGAVASDHEWIVWAAGACWALHGLAEVWRTVHLTRACTAREMRDDAMRKAAAEAATVRQDRLLDLLPSLAPEVAVDAVRAFTTPGEVVAVRTIDFTDREASVGEARVESR